MKFYSIFGLFMLSFFGENQAMLPRAPSCRIPWTMASTNGFKVFWNKIEECKSYTVELFKGYSKMVLRKIKNIEDNKLMIDGLQEDKFYGVRVSCMGSKQQMSMKGKPCQIRTMGGNASTTTTLAPTAPTPVGACGRGYFTCVTNEIECIDEALWCNSVMDCSDGTDEKDCPGHCEEIVAFDESHGNYSCSMWNSRNSVCMFECDPMHWETMGDWHVMCLDSGWSGQIPTCRLLPPQGMVENDGEYERIIELYVATEKHAKKLIIVSVVDEKGNKPRRSYFRYKMSNWGIARGSLRNLPPGHTYQLQLLVEDKNGIRSRLSRTITGKTAGRGYAKRDRLGNLITNPYQPRKN